MVDGSSQTAPVTAKPRASAHEPISLSPKAWALAKDAWSARDKADDFGRFARFVWMAHEGWTVADSSFVQEILTT